MLTPTGIISMIGAASEIICNTAFTDYTTFTLPSTSTIGILDLFKCLVDCEYKTYSRTLMVNSLQIGVTTSQVCLY